MMSRLHLAPLRTFYGLGFDLFTLSEQILFAL
jgi:hypothetical protein